MSDAGVGQSFEQCVVLLPGFFPYFPVSVAATNAVFCVFPQLKRLLVSIQNGCFLVVFYPLVRNLQMPRGRRKGVWWAHLCLPAFRMLASQGLPVLVDLQCT